MLLLERPARLRMWEEVVPLIDQAGVEVLAGTVFGRGPLHEQLEALGWETFDLDSQTSRHYPGAARRLRRLARQHEIPIIHGTETIPAFIAGLAGLGARDLKTIFHRQHLYFAGNRKLSALSRAASRLTEMTLACSEAAGRYAQENDRVPTSKVRVAYNGANRLRDVSREEVLEVRQRIGASPDDLVVGCVARLRHEKGIDVLIDAASQLPTEVADGVRVVVVGEGEEREALAAAAAASATPVHLAGFQADVAPWLAASDVVAMPSRREAFGVAAAEAMSAGRPVVASSVGGLVEVVDDGVTGLLVPPEDAEALAGALSSLLTDAGRREAMGRAGYARFEHRFTNAAMVEGWLACYSEMLSHGRPRLLLEEPS
jgi:glycosyltransferase involved in cell wall biosynthesis